MKFALKHPQLNRRWLMLGGAIVIGVVATGLSHKTLHEQRAQLETLVRAAHRMVSVVIATRDIPSAAICLWSCQLPVPIANMPMVTMRPYSLRARSLHRTRIA